MAKLTEQQKKQLEEQEREINAAISNITGGDSKQLTDQQIMKLKAMGELLSAKPSLTSAENFILSEIKRREQNEWKPVCPLPIQSTGNYVSEISFMKNKK